MSLALNKQSQALFAKAVKNIKDLLKKGKLKPKNNNPALNKKGKKVRRERGLIYLGHLPHGFYEPQMREYFEQFGIVTHVRVMRSRNTGRSKGYAFIEFLHPEVAQVVAETMNNYLMNNRLLKAQCIPPEKQRKDLFSNPPWSKTKYPKLFQQKKHTLQKNADQDPAHHQEFVSKQVKKLSALQGKLKAKGISFNFKFSDMPVEVEAAEPSISKQKVAPKTSPKQKQSSVAKNSPKLPPNVSVVQAVLKQESDNESSESSEDESDSDSGSSDSERIAVNVRNVVKTRSLQPGKSARPLLGAIGNSKLGNGNLLKKKTLGGVQKKQIKNIPRVSKRVSGAIANSVKDIMASNDVVVKKFRKTRSSKPMAEPLLEKFHRRASLRQK